MSHGADHDIKTLLADTPRPVVLDVGANTGQTVVHLRGLLPDCRLHCFEPGPSAFRELESNTAGLADLCLNRVAVGAAADVLRFHENDHSDMSSFLPLGGEGWGKVTGELDVRVVTVDDYCSAAGIERVDLLKSDTQGFDLEVFRGAERLLRAGRVGLLYTEVTFLEIYEGLPGFDQIYRFLVDRGMRLVGLYNYVMRDGVAAWCDALFAFRPPGS